jgi:hypothetical protein
MFKGISSLSLYLLLVVTTPLSYAADEVSLPLQPLANDVSLDGHIDEEEWTESQKLSTVSADKKGTFDVYSKYDLDKNILYLGLTADDDTPMKDYYEQFAVMIDLGENELPNMTTRTYTLSVLRDGSITDVPDLVEFTDYTDKFFAVYGWDEISREYMLLSPSSFPLTFDVARHTEQNRWSAEFRIMMNATLSEHSMRIVQSDVSCEGCTRTVAEFGTRNDQSTWYKVNYAEVPEFPVTLFIVIGGAFAIFFLASKRYELLTKH